MVSRTRALVLANLIAIVLLAVACDENGSSTYSARNANSTPTKETPAAAPVTESDREFATKATMGGKHEVELGKLAAERASNSEVKAFANRMVQDHSRAGDELSQITSRLGISVPSSDDPAFKETYDRLSRLKGDAFDKAYMNDMVNDHMKDVAEIESYANTGNNPDLKSWAAKVVPVVREHLKMAQDINAKLNGKAK